VALASRESREREPLDAADVTGQAAALADD
jgi:hypothetical protein